MSARPLSLNEELQGLVPYDRRASASGWNIKLNVDMRGDTGHLFNALIEPEYRELWLRLPGLVEACGLLASQAGYLLRLDYFRKKRSDPSIDVAYHTSSEHKII